MRAKEIKEERRFITDDGRAFEVLQDAQRHADWLTFRDWCTRNVCVGGDWSGKEVAEAIWNSFNVTPKQESCL